jgi:hypothetical protein
MSHRVRLSAVIAALIGIILMSSTIASAAVNLGCTNNTGCAAGTTCQLVWSFLGVKYRTCKAPPLCNTDAECRGGTRCLSGVCQAGCRTDADCPAGRCQNSTCVTATGGGGGGGVAEGRHCIPPDGSKPNSWATDSHGKPLGPCPTGTTCNNQGFCTKPPQ